MGFDTPTLTAAPAAPGPRAVDSFRMSVETTKALADLARAQHTTVSTVLQAGWAQLRLAEGDARAGQPQDMDPVEGWILSA